MNPDISTPHPTTVRIPMASGDELETWVYRPEGKGPHPAVVMAHGFAAVKAGGLAAFAERFRREGFTAVVFDYRQWGGSSGQPRDEVSVPRQREDSAPASGHGSPVLCGRSGGRDDLRLPATQGGSPPTGCCSRARGTDDLRRRQGFEGR